MNKSKGNQKTPLVPLWTDFTYFPHQEIGVRWMLDKERKGTNIDDDETVYGGLQCDDMGLGKTIQIVATMINHPQDTTLLFAPLAMIETWSSVCARAGMTVYEAREGEWSCQYASATGVEVYITNYEKVYSSPSLFLGSWGRIVLDEAHKIRNGPGRLAQAISSLDSAIRWAVTGTPVVNSLKDVVSLLAFLGVGVSPSYRWEKRFYDLLPSLVLHRTLDSVRAVVKGAPPVPKVYEVVIPFLTKEEEEFYCGIQGVNKEQLQKYAHDQLNSAQAFQLLLRLRQLAVHPQVYINAKRRDPFGYARKDWEGASSKLKAVADLIQVEQEEEEEESAHKYIVFCQFSEEMDLYHSYFVEEGILPESHVLKYDGSLSQKQRTAVLETSKTLKGTQVLLLQLQAGGVGLNLQEYDRVIFVSPYWTAALMDQAIARAVRMGQTKTVHIYHLRLQTEVENAINIDQLVNKRAEEKRQMLKQLFRICDGEKTV